MHCEPRHTAASAALVCILSALPAFAVDYHVDCLSGDDGRDGRSPDTAWRTVAKVSATTFQPGDSILLRRGTRCTGVLWPKGSGQPGKPIRLAAYGEGPLPIVDAAGGEAAVKLFDQQQWEIETIEATGGNPYGVFVSGSKGVLRHFRLRNIVVHGVPGEPKTKATGLVVLAAGSGGQTFEDVVVDGVTAYDTTQWAGIEVHGATWEDKGLRARHVTIRNSIVHDVDGDGIVLFQVEDGLIERSAAWRTGLQARETIGTPNGIWTWRCRRCTVRWTEGFFIDSPGVDGGVYDVDWGNDDNVVEHNFGHDAMGYCLAVFAAGGETTTNSVVRQNVCVNDGRSPKLARRQGDLFISTWEGGTLDGVRVENNTFFWNPPIDVPVVQMDHADFGGTRPNVFQGNVVYSSVPSMIHSGEGLRFDRNLYWYGGAREPSWSYGGREHVGFAAYRRDAGQDAAGLFADPKLTATMRPRDGSPAIVGVMPLGADVGAPQPLPASAAPVDGYRGSWALVSALAEDDDSRAQVVFLQAALEQYGDRGLVVAAGFPAGASSQLAYDWNLGAIRTFTSTPTRAETFPTTLLVSPAGTVVRRWEGFAHPADLGLTLRALIGPPAGSPPVELPADGAIAGVSAAIPPGQDLRRRVGVFLRCTGQEDPRKALEAVRSLGLERVQVSRLPDRFYTPEGAREFERLLKETGLAADAVVVVFDGESYADRDSVMRTVGLRPAALRPARMEYAKRCIDFAKAIGTGIVTFHMGFLPKDPKDPLYAEMRDAVSTLAAYAAAKGVTLSLETGQEAGDELARFLDSITVARVGVNFDTANLVLYGEDDPPRALERLLDRVTSIHVKDGLPPDDPRLLGREVPLGEGKARVRECLRLLEKAGFSGPLIIENYTWRDRGTDPLQELARSRDFILGAASPVPADLPWVGRWKINVARSSFGESTVAYAVPGPGEMQWTTAGVTMKFKVDGKDYPDPWGGTSAWRQVDASTWEVVNKVHGEVVSTDVQRVSPDGKTLTVRSKGARPDGKAFEDERVYARVSGGPGLPGEWKTSRVSSSAPGVIAISAHGTDGLAVRDEWGTSWSARFDGEDNPVEGPAVPDGFTIALRRTGPASVEYVQKQNGKELARGTWTVSADGRTITSVDAPAGTSEKTTAVYDRR